MRGARDEESKGKALASPLHLIGQFSSSGFYFSLLAHRAATKEGTALRLGAGLISLIDFSSGFHFVLFYSTRGTGAKEGKGARGLEDQGEEGLGLSPVLIPSGIRRLAPGGRTNMWLREST